MMMKIIVIFLLISLGAALARVSRSHINDLGWQVSVDVQHHNVMQKYPIELVEWRTAGVFGVLAMGTGLAIGWFSLAHWSLKRIRMRKEPSAEQRD